MGVYSGPEIAENGLVLCLDAGNPRSYPGSGTNWVDVISGSNGTLTNGPTYSSGNGGIISFNGVDNYITTALDGSTTFFPTSNFSISCWVNFSTTITDTCGTVVGCFNYDGYGIFWDNRSVTNGFAVGAQMRARNNSVLTNIFYNISSNIWYYVVMTYSSSQNFIKLYLNGSEVASSSSITGEYLNIIGQNISIGSNYVANGTSTPTYFSGKMSQILIYKKPLTPSEIQQNFNATRGRFGI